MSQILRPWQNFENRKKNGDMECMGHFQIDRVVLFSLSWIFSVIITEPFYDFHFKNYKTF